MSYAYECHWILSTKICENFDATKFRIGITLSVLFLFVCMCARTHSKYSSRKYTSLIRHHGNISICSMESLKMPMFTFFVDWQNVWFEQNLQIYSPECQTNSLAQYQCRIGQNNAKNLNISATFESRATCFSVKQCTMLFSYSLFPFKSLYSLYSYYFCLNVNQFLNFFVLSFANWSQKFYLMLCFL